MVPAWQLFIIASILVFVKTQNNTVHENVDNLTTLNINKISARDEAICNELVRSTPNFCDIALPKKKCKTICSAAVLPQLDCGKKIPMDPTKRKKKENSKKTTEKKKSKKEMKNKENAEKRIVGGKISKRGEWPWQVLLMRRLGNPLNDKEFCGGAILSEHFILTAAHCFDSRYNPKSHVYVGEHDRTLDEANEKLHTIKQVIKHPGYRYYSGNKRNINDIAIVQLDEAIKMEHENKGRICLPDDNFPIPTKMECYSTGWGFLKYGGLPSDQLRHVKVKRISNRKCAKSYGSAFSLTKGQTCAGYARGKKDACTNDSGGSMACKLKETDLWYSTGIVSFGHECAKPKYYGVYTDTTFYKSWIVNAILARAKDL